MSFPLSDSRQGFAIRLFVESRIEAKKIWKGSAFGVHTSIFTAAAPQGEQPPPPQDAYSAEDVNPLKEKGVTLCGFTVSCWPGKGRCGAGGRGLGTRSVRVPWKGVGPWGGNSGEEVDAMRAPPPNLGARILEFFLGRLGRRTEGDEDGGGGGLRLDCSVQS